MLTLVSSASPENDEEPVPQPVAPKVTAGRKKFDDEDVEDQIKVSDRLCYPSRHALTRSLPCSSHAQDDWEEEDSEPEAPTNTRAAVVLPAKKKKSVKQKIAEKEEEERKRRELGLDVRMITSRPRESRQRLTSVSFVYI